MSDSESSVSSRCIAITGKEVSGDRPLSIVAGERVSQGLRFRCKRSGSPQLPVKGNRDKGSGLAGEALVATGERITR